MHSASSDLAVAIRNKVDAIASRTPGHEGDLKNIPHVRNSREL
jgi:hypothetical protein